MDDVLTITEIEAQFASEWILVADPLIDWSLEVQSGKVSWRSKDRDEVYRKAVELRPKRFAVLYTGKIPKIPQSYYECPVRPATGANRRSRGVVGTYGQRQASVWLTAEALRAQRR